MDYFIIVYKTKLHEYKSNLDAGWLIRI